MDSSDTRPFMAAGAASFVLAYRPDLHHRTVRCRTSQPTAGRGGHSDRRSCVAGSFGTDDGASRLVSWM